MSISHLENDNPITLLPHYLPSELYHHYLYTSSAPS
uniref:Uncharacterized protein n=1 Tax=Arundo donax TaxID=35708 RepID=A0A0A8XX11_ARUDO